MLEDSREDIGHLKGLGQKRNGTELMSANLMENGTKLLRIRCSTLQKGCIQKFRATSALERRELKAKGKE